MMIERDKGEGKGKGLGYRLYVLSPQLFKRLCNSHGEVPKCYSCDRVFEIGIIIHSQKRKHNRLRCIECAKKLNLIAEKDISPRILEIAKFQ